MSIIVSLAAAAALLDSSSAPVLPQERAETLTRLTACRGLTDAPARLACYDAAVVALDDAERQGELVVMDRAQISETRRQLFGFEMPSLPRLLGTSPDADIDSIETTLEQATQSGDRWVFRLADGSVWGQVDSARVFIRDRPGQPVRVRKASLGSFFLTVGDSRAVRVRRQ